MAFLNKPRGLLLASLCAVAGPARAEEPLPPLESRVKAAFLFHFAQLTTWPAGTFPTNDTPITIGVVADDPVAQALTQAVETQYIGQRPVVVTQPANAAEWQRCQVLFVSQAAASQWPEILAAVPDRPILTVNDADGSASRAGMINLFVEAGKLRFDINLTLAQRSGLTISSRLLRLARPVVTPAPAKERN
jgi:hypothetical protein